MWLLTTFVATDRNWSINKKVVILIECYSRDMIK